MNKIFLVLLGTLALVACGGGGGGGSSPVPAGTTGGGAASGTGGGSGNQPPPAASVDLIRGAITGFGSVFIDGQRFDTSDATFSKDDDDATQDDLSIGMIVEVRGDISNGTASSVVFEEDIKGPIDDIAPGLDELTVLGQTVRITQNTALDDRLDLSALIVGDVLEVSGLRGENDVLEASFVEHKLASEVNAYKVIGSVRDLDTTVQTFRVGGLTVDYSIAQLDDGVVIESGLAVEVKDETRAYSPGDFTLIASKIEPAGLGRGGAGNGDDNNPTFARVQTEGLITNVVDGTRFELAGTVVNHDSSTEFVFGDASLISVGTKVQVEGSIPEDGSITATKIKFARNSARLHGQVETVDPDASTLAILGVTIDLSQVQEFDDSRDDVEPFGVADIMIGDYLEVRGNSSGDLVIANEVERDDDDDTRLRGPADDVDAEAGTLGILGVSITTSASTQYRGFSDEALTADAFFAALAGGQTLVDAQWNGTVTDTSVAVRELSMED